MKTGLPFFAEQQAPMSTQISVDPLMMKQVSTV